MVSSLRSSRFVIVFGALVAALLCLPALSGCSAQAEPQASIVGVWGDPDASEKPSLEFTEEGEYSGTDSCNLIGGSYEATGGAASSTFSLGEMRSTMRFCQNADTWLSFAREVSVSGDTLTFTDTNGKIIGELHRHTAARQ